MWKFNQPLLSWDTSLVTDMHGMFHVRSPRASHPGMLRAHRARPPPPAPPARSPQSPPSTVCTAWLRPSAQQTVKFNQPLSWDTSRVMSMSHMFYVRARPDLQSHSLPGTMRAPRSSPRTVCPCLRPSAQFATAFNQRLRWDTSRVTNMDRMFEARASPRAPCPLNLQSRHLAARTLVPTRSLVPIYRQPIAPPLFLLGRGPRVVGSSENRNRYHRSPQP